MLTVETFKVNLESERFHLLQTQPRHYDALYQVASDAKLWAQHPQSDRWKPDVFKRFFDVGLQNPEGCFTIVDKGSGEVVGSTRFYGLDVLEPSIRLGYSFIARSLWGGGANQAVKHIQLSFLFNHVNAVYFEIGEQNIRSQKALAKFPVESYPQDERAIAVGNLLYRMSRDAYLEMMN